MVDKFPLFDIEVPTPNKALAQIVSSAPGLSAFLLKTGQEVVTRYQAHVARKTGRLAESALTHVVMGGNKKNDRMVGKVTVGGQAALSEWKGEPFSYGLIHEFGSRTKKIEFPAADDLVEVMKSMYGGR
ncbi:Uncharacterised protein [Mycobacteroides abscessus subsp. abscessus]|uniref:hypothetical protein n=1 Tax=Mycobacteroides abscessus TaxID=36809 RepID=UPI0009A83E74|nr:hypothetical protein [Mycobacteroides abscessus]SKU47277.1 Uncharacterised protein [Mycobacteroides abscessus subsp. abscessus]